MPRGLHNITKPLYLLVFQHPDLATPQRFVLDNAGATIEGQVYEPANAKISLPDFGDASTTGSISISNLDRRAVQLFEGNPDLRNATATISIWQRGLIEIPWSITLRVLSPTITSEAATIPIAYPETLTAPAVHVSYDRSKLPGLFK